MAAQKRDHQLFLQSSSQKRVRRQYHHHNGFINIVARAATPTVYLPDDCLDNIFSFLPVKKAIQIGAPSRRFKASWLFSRKLYFDREFARSHGQADFLSVVGRVFELHKGPKIESFRLHIDATGIESTVNIWIKKSIEKGVEDVDFDFIQGRNPFKISYLFDVESIRVVKLCHCVLELQPKLKGLRFLNTLVLRRVDVSEKLIQSLLTNCVCLEELDIADSNMFRHIKIYARYLKRFKVLRIGMCHDIDMFDIDAPTLQSFHYVGPICIFRIGVVSQLNDVFLYFGSSRIAYTQHFKAVNLVSDFNHIHVLTTTSTFLEGLCTRMINGNFTDLQYCFWNLKELQLFMDGAIYCNLYDIAAFLKNCVCIERLFIDLNDCSFDCGYYWEFHQKPLLDLYPQFFYHLRSIKIKGFKFQKHELEMVKFFLEKAVYLETFVLVTPKNNKTKVFATDILLYDRIFRCWRASPRAEILMYEHFNDRSPISAKHPKFWY